MLIRLPLLAALRQVGVTAAFCLPVSLLQAQTVVSRDTAVTLAPARVTARHVARPSAEAMPRQWLDSAALRRRGVTDMGDALRRLPGINLRDYGGAGGLKTVSVRGLGAAHTIVCYDGLPVGAARQGEADLGRFSTDHLAGIGLHVAEGEQLLTPVRTLGAAVVELRSVLPDSAARGLHGRASLAAAAFGTANPALLLTLRPAPRTALTAAADFYYGRNDYPFRLTNGILQTEERRSNSRMQAWRGELGLNRQTRTGGTWQSRLYFYDSHRRLPGAVKYYTDDANERLHERQVFVQTAWRQNCGDHWQLMAAGKYTNDLSRYLDPGNEYPGGALMQRYRSHETYATAGAAWRQGPFSAALAADYTFETLRSNVEGSRHVGRHSLMPALSLRYARHGFAATARLVGSFCRNHDYRGGRPARDVSRLSPSVALAWQPAGAFLTLRAYYKELFRPPSFTESYYYHYGSQDLRPETTRQIGAGLTLTAGGGTAPWQLRLTADGYLNRVADRITGIPVNLYVWQTFNMGRVRIWGADAALNASWHPAPDHGLYFSANYTLQRAADRSDPAAASYGKQPAYMPLHAGAASLAWENPWLGIALHATGASERFSTNEHVDGTRIAGYVEAGAAVYRTFRLHRCRLTLRADLMNAFNRQYEIIRRYPMPGRAWKCSATLAW